jgi:hypothetical protein
MSDTDIHSCGYYCDRQACILAQRNELRDKLFGEQWVKTYSGGKPNYTQPEEISTSERSIQISDNKEAESARSWVGLPNDEVLERANKFRDPETYLRGVLWAEAKLKEKNT